MSDIKKNLEGLWGQIPSDVKLVAVSKTQSTETIMEAYAAGQRAFGENKAQELISKQASLPADIEWHFIGHLQTNKVKYMVPFVSLIHGVDSYKLLKEINKQAFKVSRVVDCLLQFHIASEETKFGLDLEEAKEILEDSSLNELNNINITGVMGMGTFTDDESLIHQEFRFLKQLFDQLKQDYFPDKPDFQVISMGMSGDYQIAIEEGSNLVRIGTTIFGARSYYQD